MKKLIFNTIFSFLISTFSAYAQPYVVNEQLEKIFSEGFTDVNSSFPITSSGDPKFWASYGDGYYYMERKITSPRAIIADFKAISKNLAIKTKIQLGPVRSSESSVGVMFLVQPRGKGGFLFEINRKRSFRIKDLSNGAFITKEGENGWIKSKAIAPATRNNTIEIKGFRGKFDIYINNLYLYSFINNSYQSGKSGVYLGQNASARMYYFNLYKLNIPGAPLEVNLENLQRENLLLKEENDSLKTLEIQARFEGNDKGMISAIKILEEQISSVNEENSQLNKTLKEYKESQASLETKEAERTSNTASEKISSLFFERDSLKVNNESLSLKLTSTQKEKDSVQLAFEQMKSKMKVLESHMVEVNEKILEIKSREKEALVKEPSKPSVPPISPMLTSSKDKTVNNTHEVTDDAEILKADSTSKNAINIDKKIGLKNDNKEVVKESSKPSVTPTLPSSMDETVESTKEVTIDAEILKADSTSKNAVNIDEKIGLKNDNREIVKESSKPSVTPTLPSSTDETVESTKEVTNDAEILKADSTSKNAVNIDEKIGLKNDNKEVFKESSKPSVTPALPPSIKKNLDSTQELTNDAEILKADSTSKNALNIDEKIGSENDNEAIVNDPDIPAVTSMDENLNNTQEITNGAELLKADSTYEHTIDIDEEIGFENNDKEGGLDEETPSLTPLKSQVIKVKKAVKAELKD